MSRVTQAESIASLRKAGVTGRQQVQVYTALLQHPGSTRNELYNRTENLRLSSICGRVNELIEKGLVMEMGTKLDPQTKKNVACLWVRLKTVEQLNLFGSA